MRNKMINLYNIIVTVHREDGNTSVEKWLCGEFNNNKVLPKLLIKPPASGIEWIDT